MHDLCQLGMAISAVDVSADPTEDVLQLDLLDLAVLTSALRPKCGPLLSFFFTVSGLSVRRWLVLHYVGLLLVLLYVFFLHRLHRPTGRAGTAQGRGQAAFDLALRRGTGWPRASCS